MLRAKKLSKVVKYSEDKIEREDVSLENFITTDNILQNKLGKTKALNLPPSESSMTKYLVNDILVANIRPYLKKIWFSDRIGGCSADVLVFNVNSQFDPKYVYYALFRDDFFNHMVKGSKGTKMPRGDKKQIMDFTIPEKSILEQQKIVAVLSAFDSKIELNNRINAELEAMAKTIYYYWFVQFDFPNENGKPYKSSGGKMVFNKQLKREIPDGWEVKNIFALLDVQYGYPFDTSLFSFDGNDFPIARIRDILACSSSAYTMEVVNNKFKLSKGDLIIGMDGNFHINFWDKDSVYLNQRCVRLRQIDTSEVSSLQLYFEITPYLRMREDNISRTTVGHLSDKDLKDLYILNPIKTLKFNPKSTFNSIMSQIISNRIQNQHLTQLRDWLLPMLMNGQVKVK